MQNQINLLMNEKLPIFIFILMVHRNFSGFRCLTLTMTPLGILLSLFCSFINFLECNFITSKKVEKSLSPIFWMSKNKNVPIGHFPDIFSFKFLHFNSLRRGDVQYIISPLKYMLRPILNITRLIGLTIFNEAKIRYK